MEITHKENCSFKNYGVDEEVCDCKEYAKDNTNEKEEMYCRIGGCGRVDKTHTAYCIEHGRSPHGMRKVVETNEEVKK